MSYHIIIIVSVKYLCSDIVVYYINIIILITKFKVKVVVILLNL